MQHWDAAPDSWGAERWLSYQTSCVVLYVASAAWQSREHILWATLQFGNICPEMDIKKEQGMTGWMIVSPCSPEKTSASFHSFQRLRLVNLCCLCQSTQFHRWHTSLSNLLTRQGSPTKSMTCSPTWATATPKWFTVLQNWTEKLTLNRNLHWEKNTGKHKPSNFNNARQWWHAKNRNTTDALIMKEREDSNYIYTGGWLGEWRQLGRTWHRKQMTADRTKEVKLKAKHQKLSK